MSAGAGNTADGLVLVAAPLLALQLTRDPLAISLITATAGLPWLIAALHVGALADRVPRQRLVAGAHLLRAVTLFAAAALAATGHLSLVLLYPVVLLYGLGEVFADTASQALVPSLVPTSELEHANGRLVATETVGNNFLGAPLAGALSSVGAAVTLALSAAVYALAAAAAAAIRPATRPSLTTASSDTRNTSQTADQPQLGPSGTRPQTSPSSASTATTMGAEIATGLRFLVRHRTLLALASLAGVSNVASGAYFSLLVLWLVGPGSAVGMTSTSYGLLAAGLAAGAVAGSLLTPQLTRRIDARTVMLGALVAEAGLMALMVAVPHIGVVATAAAALGAANALSNVLLVTTRQKLIPDHLLGRVTSVYRLISRGATPLGALTGGAIAAAASLPAALYCAAALGLIAVAATTRPILRRHDQVTS